MSDDGLREAIQDVGVVDGHNHLPTGRQLDAYVAAVRAWLAERVVDPTVEPATSQKWAVDRRAAISAEADRWWRGYAACLDDLIALPAPVAVSSEPVPRLL